MLRKLGLMMILHVSGDQLWCANVPAIQFRLNDLKIISYAFTLTGLTFTNLTSLKSNP